MSKRLSDCTPEQAERLRAIRRAWYQRHRQRQIELCARLQDAARERDPEGFRELKARQYRERRLRLALVAYAVIERFMAAGVTDWLEIALCLNRQNVPRYHSRRWGEVSARNVYRSVGKARR